MNPGSNRAMKKIKVNTITKRVLPAIVREGIKTKLEPNIEEIITRQPLTVILREIFIARKIPTI